MDMDVDDMLRGRCVVGRMSSTGPGLSSTFTRRGAGGVSTTFCVAWLMKREMLR